MNLDNLLTIVIPTYNRYEYLLRLLNYYNSYGFPAKIRVLDSSNDNHKQKRDLLDLLDHDSVEHFTFPPTIRVADKIAQGIRDISTPYAVLCADDDFLTPTGLEKSIVFLESNPDYAVVHGRYIVFEQNKGNPNIVEWKKCYGNKSIESNDCQNRYLAHLTDYKTPTFYAVHRAKLLKSIWIASQEYTDDDRFGELLPTCLTAVYGKIKVLDDLYSARECMSSSGGRTSKGLSDFIVEGSFDKKYERFKKCLAGTLCDQAGLSYGESKKLVDKSMNAYLQKSYGLSMNALRFKLMIKKLVIGKVINSTGLLGAYRKLKSNLKQVSSRPVVLSGISYEDPTHPCYPEFSRIREAIINSGV